MDFRLSYLSIPAFGRTCVFSFYLSLFLSALLRQHLASAPCRKVSHERKKILREKVSS